MSIFQIVSAKSWTQVIYWCILPIYQKISYFWSSFSLAKPFWDIYLWVLLPMRINMPWLIIRTGGNILKLHLTFTDQRTAIYLYRANNKREFIYLFDWSLESNPFSLLTALKPQINHSVQAVQIKMKEKKLPFLIDWEYERWSNSELNENVWSQG